MYSGAEQYWTNLFIPTSAPMEEAIPFTAVEPAHSGAGVATIQLRVFPSGLLQAEPC